ncbi:ABC transporter permease [Arthrobacter sp. MMS24-S77]
MLTFVAITGLGTVSALAQHAILEEFRKAKAQGATLTVNGQGDPAAVISLSNLPSAGLGLGIAILGALAVMFIASEYTTGMIRSTVAAVPRRVPVFTAKAVVLVVASYVITLLAAVATSLIGMAIFKGTDFELSWSTEGLLYGVLTAGLYVAGASLIALSLGTLLRNSAAGITVLLGLFFVLPLAGTFLGQIPGDFWKYVPQYLPTEAGGRFLVIGHTDGIIDPWHGGIIFLGYILIFLVPAVTILKKRDV